MGTPVLRRAKAFASMGGIGELIRKIPSVLTGARGESTIEEAVAGGTQLTPHTKEA
jgi:hypothetical protein